MFTANNVTLDCRGWEINYSQVSAGYGVAVESYNITTIKSCDIWQSALGGSPTLSSYGVLCIQKF